MSERILIKGGRVMDPANNIDGVMDVLIEDGKISKVGASIPTSGAKTVKADGLVVSPGFVDLHVHLREPGFEYKETVQSGAMAAAAGGFTTVCCMANTQPVNDNGSVTRHILDKAASATGSRVYPIGAATKGLAGKELAEIGEMKHEGIVAISDDGKCVMNARLFQNALRYASMFGLTLVEHCEDENLAAGGVINEGDVSARLGIKGIPSSAESIIARRDIAIAAETGCGVHLAHISCKETVDAVREAKAKGIKVTCEAAPHHFTLTEKELETFNSNFKMNPPLRGEEDVAALKKGLADGTIDAIATDHAPHLQWEKELEIDQAPYGVVGLETALGVSMKVVKEGVLTLNALVALLTCKPAKVFGLAAGTLGIGAPADVAIFDPDLKWTVNPATFLSKGKNTPFGGMELSGKNLMTIVGGRVVYNPTDL